jgi:hypothetical protein
MSRSSTKIVTTPTPSPTSQFRMMTHQVRMEIVAKNGVKSLDVGNILTELIVRANEKETVDFIDVTGKPFDNIQFPEADEFASRLGAETVQGARGTKVTLGFFMISSANMQRIKLSIGFPWLGQQQIYLRTQRMDFAHGTDMFLMGQLILEHPVVSNPTDVEDFISDKWYSHMDCKAAEHAMTDDDQEFLEQLQKLEEAQVIVDDVLQIPISVERTITRVDCPGKKPFEVQVYHVYVPRRFRDAATYLNDRAILETQTLTNLIPFAVVKNDPASYYPKMVAHPKFLHEHHSITIRLSLD